MADWFNDSWNYRKSHVIEQANNAGTNYQKTIKVHYSAGVDNGSDTYLGGVSILIISIPAADHEAYGLSYPATYVVNIPVDSSNLTAWHKHLQEDAFSQLTTKTSNDFFNGIECVRFDYVNNKAYISVAFDNASDDIYLMVKDSVGESVVISYNSITKHYDNRKCVVAIVADDWVGRETEETAHTTAGAQCTPRHIVLTHGIVTEWYGVELPPTWALIQTELNNGYAEVASHSKYHQDIVATSDADIYTSVDEIIANLDLPSIYKRGATEYVPGWVEPFGGSNATQRTKLGIKKYLCDRDISPDSVFAAWDATYGLYNRIGSTVWMGSDGLTNSDALNDAFNTVYNASGVYLISCHPTIVDWSNNAYAQKHLDFIKDRKDVWYVGFGALYTYYYIYERGKISTSSTSPEAHCQTDFDDIRFTASDGTTLLSHWKGSNVSSEYAVFWIKIPDNLSAGDVTIYVYYGNSEAEDISDFDNTFIFGDPFDNATLNTDRWTSVDGNPTYTIDEINHHIEITNFDTSTWLLNPSKGFHSRTDLSLPATWMIDDPWQVNANGIKQYTLTTAAGDYQIAGHVLAHTTYGSADYGIMSSLFGDASSSSYHYWWLGVGGTMGDYSTGAVAGAEKTRNFRAWKEINGNIHVELDGTIRVDEANTEVPNRFHLGIMRYSTAVFGTVQLGAFCIRNYISPEPAHGAWGGEEYQGDQPINHYKTIMELVGFSLPIIKFESQETGDTGWTIYGTDWRTQTFTPQLNYNIMKVTLLMIRSGSPSGDVIVSIRETDNNGNPTGEDLVSKAVFAMDVPEEYTDIDFIFDEQVTLIGGKKYAIVIRAPDAEFGNHLSFYAINSDVYPSGKLGYSADSGVNWTMYSAKDAYFQAWGVKSVDRIKSMYRLFSELVAGLESIGTEVLSAGIEIFREIIEYASILDTRSRVKGLYRLFEEAVGVLDSKITSIIYNIIRNITEYIGVLDTRLRKINYKRVFTDIVGFLESRSRVKSMYRTFTEYVAAFDSKVATLAHHLQRIIIETLEILDSMSAASFIIRTIVEYMSIKEKRRILKEWFKGLFKEHPQQKINKSGE